MSSQKLNPIFYDYIWLDANGLLRSKHRILYEEDGYKITDKIPEWNYDGSSTGQASINGNTEIILKPVYIHKIPEKYYNRVLCDVFDIDGKPLSNRQKAIEYFSKQDVIQEDPWFGLEQEFYLIPKDEENSVFSQLENKNEYCFVNRNGIERQIMTELRLQCLSYSIKITGFNAEVAPHQWEFQLLGKGVQICDQLYMVRYMLEGIAEKYSYKVIYSPKPHQSVSGSGCHVNFSTNASRSKDTGYEVIEEYIQRFEKNHMKLIECCSKENKERLSGKCETAKWDTFSWGVGTRNTSIRVPNEVFKNKCGYLEDRRPGADIDPYLYLTTMCQIALDN